MNTTFKKLNDGWNAEPNAPDPRISVSDQLLTLRFLLNPWAYKGFNDGDEAEIVFSDCWRYRLGGTNDEGWYRGQCRFSGIAPAWGEFYEIAGDLLMNKDSQGWILIGQPPEVPSRHFLFYLKDETFECDAKDWSLRLPHNRMA